MRFDLIEDKSLNDEIMIALSIKYLIRLKKNLTDDTYDASQFQLAFGYNTRMGLTEGLQREVAWYRSQTLSISS